MTNRSYFQFDTRSRLRRFFASSDGWSSLNKKIETTQEAGCDAEHCNQKPYSGHGLSSRRGCWLNSGGRPPGRGNDEERKAPSKTGKVLGLMTNRCALRLFALSCGFVSVCGVFGKRPTDPAFPYTTSTWRGGRSNIGRQGARDKETDYRALACGRREQPSRRRSHNRAGLEGKTIRRH
jgi:hypothetical protein